MTRGVGPNPCLSLHAVRGAKVAEVEAGPEEASESPKICCGIGKAITAMKQVITGSQGLSSVPKDGVWPLPPFQTPVNRAEVVITVRPKKALPQSLPSFSDTSSIPSTSQMGPPSSTTPSLLSVKLSGSRKRH